MIPFPISLLVIPTAAILGVFYVTLGRIKLHVPRIVARIAVLSVTWILPLATSEPAQIRLPLGLLVGFLGIRMAALAERVRSNSTIPPASLSYGHLLVAMVTPEEVLVSTRPRRTPAGVALLRGMLGVGVCAALLVVGNQVRIWRSARLADDLLVLIEVAVGAAGVHEMVVGIAGLTGRAIAGMQDQPILSASLSQFWSRRWNRLVQANLDRGFFRPFSRRHGMRGAAAWGTMAAFAASGVMHVLGVLDVRRLDITRGPAAAVLGFFLLHACLVLGERRCGFHREPRDTAALAWARFRTLALFSLLSPLLLDPFACAMHVHGRTLGPWHDVLSPSVH
jgi:Membrane bound O-acyl transferase family